MKSWMALLLLPSVVYASSVTGTLEKGPSMLILGEQKILQIQGLRRFSIGGSAVRALPLRKKSDAALSDSDEILLKGVAPGSSDLLIWKTDGSQEHRSIRVEKSDKAWLTPPLLRALGRLEEAEVLLSGSGVVLRGTIESWTELFRIDAIARGFANDVHDDTQPAPALLESASEKLQSWLRSSSFSSRLEITRDGSRVRVKGALDSVADRNWITKHVRAIYPRAEFDLQSLPDDSPTVYFRVFLLELKKTKFQSLGIAWPGGPVSAFHASTWGIQEALQFDLALQALESEGSARILSRPELVVRAPGEAELFSGGELPIRTHTQYSSQIDWKSYGLTLKLKVTHKAGSRVRLDIQTEVSHLDQNIGSDDLPGVQSNRMRTQVDARFGEPLFLSGLLQEDTRKQAKGLPFFRRIPVLGALFGSEDYLEDRSELVAILLPLESPPRAPMERVEPLQPATDEATDRVADKTANQPTPRAPAQVAARWGTKSRKMRFAPPARWRTR